jgi:hypothetical protein
VLAGALLVSAKLLSLREKTEVPPTILRCVQMTKAPTSPPGFCSPKAMAHIFLVIASQSGARTRARLSEAIHRRRSKKSWIASSQELLAMTVG